MTDMQSTSPVPLSAPPIDRPPPPRRRRRRRVLLPILSVVGVSVLGYAVTGGGDDPTPARPPGNEVSGPTMVSALDLQPGDCYNAAPLPDDGSSAPIGAIEAVPCSELHTGQVITRLGYLGEDYTDVIESRAAADCARDAQSRVRPEVLADTRFGLAHVYPAASAWQQTPSVVCVLVTEAPTTGSVLI